MSFFYFPLAIVLSERLRFRPSDYSFGILKSLSFSLNTQWKPSTCCKSLTDYIQLCRVHLVMGIGRYKYNYDKWYLMYYILLQQACNASKQNKWVCLFQKHVEYEMTYPTICSRIETRFIKFNMLIYNVNESSKSNIKNINNSLVELYVQL